MIQTRTEIRIALPSKGRLADDALDLFDRAGLRVYKPNPRQYQATIPSLPGLTVLFQRPGDIVTSISDGSVDFGLTGWDIYSERAGGNRDILVLHRDLGVGHCTLNVIVPESWDRVNTMVELKICQQNLGRPLLVGTRFPVLSQSFFQRYGLTEIQMILAEGTLEIAPTIGYADIIVDLVSTGTTLRDNRLKTLTDGMILHSQACLLANRTRLRVCPKTLSLARKLLEFIVAYLRAAENVAVFANMRGQSPQIIAENMHALSVIGGLQGPTISNVFTRNGENWFAVNIVVRKDQLAQAIAELRQIGGSGVVVTPVMYIFEEEPQSCCDLETALEDE